MWQDRVKRLLADGGGRKRPKKRARNNALPDVTGSNQLAKRLPRDAPVTTATVTTEGAEASAFRVLSSESMGRSLVASRPLRAGEVLLRCLPWCAILADEHIGRRCAGCMRQLDSTGMTAPPPCSRCGTAFCSSCASIQSDRQGFVAGSARANCSTLAGAAGLLSPAVIHADECAALESLRRQQRDAASCTDEGMDAEQEDTSLVRAVIRTLCWQRRQRRLSPVGVHNIKAFEMLEHHWDDMDDTTRRRMARIARRAIDLLDDRGTNSDAAAGSQVKDKKRRARSATLLGCRLFVNSMALSAEGEREDSGSSESGLDFFHPGPSIGVGLFGMAALLNHSCAPNATWSIEWTEVASSMGGTSRASSPSSPSSAYLPLTMVVRVTQPIRAGEHIMISYINLCQHTDARRAELASNFFFSCQCKACKATDASSAVSDAERQGWLCGGATAQKTSDNCTLSGCGAILRTKPNGNLDNDTIKCTVCGHSQRIAPFLTVEADIAAAIAASQEHAQDQEHALDNEMRSSLIRHMQIAKRALHARHSLRYALHALLAPAMAATAPRRAGHPWRSVARQCGGARACLCNEAGNTGTAPTASTGLGYWAAYWALNEAAATLKAWRSGEWTLLDAHETSSPVGNQEMSGVPDNRRRVLCSGLRRARWAEQLLRVWRGETHLFCSGAKQLATQFELYLDSET